MYQGVSSILFIFYSSHSIIKHIFTKFLMMQGTVFGALYELIFILKNNIEGAF